ncbi:MAG: DMT family transporter [Puniceicoccaceae bacterium]
MRYLLLLIGVFACATSVIFIKIGSTHPIALSAYRLLLGGLCLLPLAIAPWRRRGELRTGLILKQALPPALFLGIHFITWIIGARMTPSANASLIVNMVPVVMPFLLLVVVEERITRAEGAGTLLGMTGVVLLGLGDLNLSPEYAMGDLVCFLSMLFYAFYLIYARKNREMASIYLYVVPVYLIAGIFCLAIAILLHLSGHEIGWIGPDLRLEWISILGLALVPTVLGHSLINWALTRIRGQAVVIINLAQFIFAGIMGYLLLDEIPALVFYISSALVVVGAVIVIRQSHTAS